MPPITMAHMTSISILPMLSFATVQYDWEWKYSEGDVQGRFPRKTIQLVSDGELAGTWLALLGDQGALANDPWTLRTFTVVCLVHEMEPNGSSTPSQPSAWSFTGNVTQITRLCLLDHRRTSVFAAY